LRRARAPDKLTRTMGLRTPALVMLISLISLAWAAPAAAAKRVPRGPRGEVMPAELAKLYDEPGPTIELVTMGIGALIWERHGHIALCIRNDNPADDVCYNYGVADFHKPLGMAWGFFRGTNSFWVAKQDPHQMLAVYTHADRTVWVQPLPLTVEQKKLVIDKLESDILEDHKYYAYDHFDDNCTTRVRDVIDNAVVGDLKRKASAEPADGKTFRDLARDGFFGMRVPLLITDIAMGRSTDRVPSYWERMFLPQYLREAVHKLWHLDPFVIYERQGAPPLDDGPSGRVWFSLIVILLTAPVWLTRRWGRFQRLGLGLAIGPPVLLGTIFWFLAIISPLPYGHVNESCLFLLPTDLLMLFFGPTKRRLYARGRVGMLVLLALLMLVGIIKQPLWPLFLWAVIPAAVVGFWPERAPDAAAVVEAKPASVPPTKKKPNQQRKSDKKRR
jgi:hypothetical protein